MNKIIFILILFFPLIVFAHNPRIVSDTVLTKISNPEISQAFYGELKGEENYFEIDSPESFELYISVLVPKIENIEKDISVEIYYQDQSIDIIDGVNFEWQEYHEEFADDDYYQGPQKKFKTKSGQYILKVFSPNNFGKYVLVIGQKEELSPAEIFNIVRTLPKIKRDFFVKSYYSAFFNKIGLFIFGPVALILLFIVMLVLFIKAVRLLKEAIRI